MAEPDIFEFEDWLEEKTGPWPWDKDRPLTDDQKRIVAQNAVWLGDRGAWDSRVELFESALFAIEDENDRKQERLRYRIHFDRHDFGAAPLGHNFSDYRFPCSVSFDDASFGSGRVSFRKASFNDGDVLFDRANFGDGDVWFDGAIFANGVVSFYEAAFRESTVSFNKATFGEGDVWFRGATFDDCYMSFQGTTFGEGDVRFDETMFDVCQVTFNRATFGYGNFWFAPDKLESTSLSFENIAAIGNILVTAQFPEAAIFARLKVDGTASFSDCGFAQVPDFRDAKFGSPPEVARMDVPRPKLKLRGVFHIAADPDDVAKFRKLKAMAIAANDHERDGYFFAREMMAKRGIETKGFLPLFLDSAYALLSDYGQSIGRPLWGFLASIVAFATLYSGVLFGQVDNALRFALAPEYSARNALPFLNVLFHNALAPSGFSTGFEARLDTVYRHLYIHGKSELFDWLIGFSVAQQLFGGLLLFLLLLGLRNKFRLK